MKQWGGRDRGRGLPGPADSVPTEFSAERPKLRSPSPRALPFGGSDPATARTQGPNPRARGGGGPCHERGPSAMFARPQPCAHGVGALRATRRGRAHLRVRAPGGRQGAGRVEGESMTIRVQLESHSKATRWQRGATPTRTSTGIVRSRFAASFRARRSRRERSRVRPLRPLSLEPLGGDEQQSQGRSVRHGATMSTPGTARTRAHTAPLYKGAVRHVCAHKRDVGRAGFRTQAQWPRAITKN